MSDPEDQEQRTEVRAESLSATTRGRRPRPSGGSRLRSVARMTDLSSVALVFPIAALLGFFLGRLVGGWFGAARGGALVGLLLGIVSGFYNLWKVARQLEQEAAPRRSASPPDDPSP